MLSAGANNQINQSHISLLIDLSNQGTDVQSSLGKVVVALHPSSVSDAPTEMSLGMLK
jgi:hypothetical protein